MPLLFAHKDVFDWLRQGKKTIDVRKGKGRKGDEAIFQCGSKILRLRILKRESGQLREIVRLDNFRQVIPSATNLEDAINYFSLIYRDCADIFTAYYLEETADFAEKA